MGILLNRRRSILVRLGGNRRIGRAWRRKRSDGGSLGRREGLLLGGLGHRLRHRRERLGSRFGEGGMGSLEWKGGRLGIGLVRGL